VLTKAQERAKTVCRAVGDEDPRRRWGGAHGPDAVVVLRFLGPSIRCEVGLWR